MHIACGNHWCLHAVNQQWKLPFSKESFFYFWNTEQYLNDAITPVLLLRVKYLILLVFNADFSHHFRMCVFFSLQCLLNLSWNFLSLIIGALSFSSPLPFLWLSLRHEGLLFPAPVLFALGWLLWFISAGMPCHCLGTHSVCSEQSLRIALKVIRANKYLKLLLATMINNYVNMRLRETQETAKLDLPQIPTRVRKIIL